MRLNWKPTSVAASALALSGALGLVLAAPAAKDGTPSYKYDAPWPKELRNKRTMEGITGRFVDKDDHIWVLNRPRDFDERENMAAVNPPAGECCVPPPAVMEFDTQGNLLTAWGVPNSVPGWPKSEHTIFTDRAGNVYIGGAQAGDSPLQLTQYRKPVSHFWKHRPAVPGQT